VKKYYPTNEVTTYYVHGSAIPPFVDVQVWHKTALIRMQVYEQWTEIERREFSDPRQAYVYLLGCRLRGFAVPPEALGELGSDRWAP